MNPELMAVHVQKLCDRYRVDCQHRRAGGRAWPHTRGGMYRGTISIAPVRGIVSYATALHEIGHLVGRGRSGRSLEREAAAWLWARKHRSGRLTTEQVAAFDEDMRKSLTSYLEWALVRQYREHARPAIPQADTLFWRLINRAEVTA